MTLKTARSYRHSSGQNTGTWRKDGRADRQTDSPWLLQRSALQPMRTRCKNDHSDATYGFENELCGFLVSDLMTITLCSCSVVNLIADAACSIQNIHQRSVEHSRSDDVHRTVCGCHTEVHVKKRA